MRPSLTTAIGVIIYFITDFAADSLSIFSYSAYPVISLLLPLILIDPNEKANMETMMDQQSDGKQLRNTMFGNPRVILHLKLILPWAYHRGLFEYCKNK